MKKLLNILGIIIFTGSVIIGAISGAAGGAVLSFSGGFSVTSSGGFLGFFSGLIIGIIGGIFASAVFFGLAALLGGQEDIMAELHDIKSHAKDVSVNLNGRPVCPKCKKEYDPDYTSCPHCGFKE